MSAAYCVRRFVVACLVLLVFVGENLQAPARGCTTGVVSGRATADGRPLLWKNRDTKEQHNQVVYSDKGRYAYMAVVNAGSGSSVWMGVNAAGFCIENSLIKDMPRDKRSGPGNGQFMKQALETCATVEDFEALLNETNETGRTTQSNFGVIDAAGGAAIFETGHNAFVKFDANDPQTAPQGFVVRSNFSMTGTGNDKLSSGEDLADIYSGERYLRAQALFEQAAAERTLDGRYILERCSRDLTDAEGRPLPGSINGPAGLLPETIDTASTLCRRTTVSVAVFQGVRPGDDPRLTTMWVILGDPTVAVAVPCWVAAAAVAPELKGQKRSPFCTAALALRTALYDDEGKLLRTERLPAIWEQTRPAEASIFHETEATLARWRKSLPAADEMQVFHQTMAERAMHVLSRLQEQYVPTAITGD